MKLGIDASNLRAGGGVTHLAELLRAADPPAHGFEQIIVWSGAKTLVRLAEREWLIKRHERMLDRSLPFRCYWQRFVLDRLARREKCDILLVPGSTFSGSFRPFVTVSQNLLPFDLKEARRFGTSWMFLKMRLLHQTQARTFRKADGVIFLTEYARDMILRQTGRLRGRSVVIPHGIERRFFAPPRLPDNPAGPRRILYVSIIDMYKHQWNVAEAIAALKPEYDLQLDLVGPAYAPALEKLRKTIARLDPAGSFIHYRGPENHADIQKWYQKADIFVFASSCENMPNILLEAMAAGLPIACSNRGPMPEVLGNCGEYFDPERPEEIARALRGLLESQTRRRECAQGAYTRAQQYSWERCARDTLAFLVAIAH